MAADEVVVGQAQLRVAGRDSINLFQLSGGEVFGGIETPAAAKKALPPQNLVQARDAARKAVANIKQRGVGVGEGGRSRQNLRDANLRDTRTFCGARRVNRFKKIHGAARPYSPLS